MTQHIKMNALVLALAAAIAGGTARAEPAGEAPDAFSVRGAGLLDCRTFMELRADRSDGYLMIGGWIDGYITALNQFQPDTYDITSFESTELLTEVIAGHCRDNPEHRLLPVISSIVHQLQPNRLVVPDLVESISDGERQTRMYRSTLVRMQTRLEQLGALSKDYRTGEFDAATREALRAYQKTLDYEPTGFPDQATLWHLFSQS